MHDFKYDYLYKNNLPTNQLASIPNYGSYRYDQLGQLEHEQLVGKPDRYYSYEVSGKVSGLYADANKTQPKVQFGYDAIGQRLYKYSSESQLTTYYVRDASGNVLAIYEKTGNTNPIQQEIPIYGSGRLGTLNVLARSYVYELRDHLGNVRVVVGKVNGSLDIFSQSDYYALGSVLRRSGRDYRYGYQGMYAEEDKETGKNSFELRMYDNIIGRWLSTDPAGQYSSPYVGMGNKWLSGTDADGAWFDDYYLYEDGSMEVVKTNDSYDTYYYVFSKSYTYTPSATIKGGYDIQVEMDKAFLGYAPKNENGLVRFPFSGYGFTRYGGTDDDTDGGSNGLGDHWANPEVAAALMGAAYQWHLNAGNAAPIQFGDMSGSTGLTPNDKHTSHRNGMNIDVRYIRTDGLLQPVTVNDVQYDYDLNQRLVNTFQRWGFGSIYSYKNTKGCQLEGTTQFKGHDNHLHLFGFSANK